MDLHITDIVKDNTAVVLLLLLFAAYKWGPLLLRKISGNINEVKRESVQGDRELRAYQKTEFENVRNEIKLDFNRLEKNITQKHDAQDGQIQRIIEAVDKIKEKECNAEVHISELKALMYKELLEKERNDKRDN
ncbi:hypothetical protein KAR91_11060 [Candidatus Pacearchaeota archaeon]|nr:hypothetical protein [Candidatus Pacearchaeota archaeon]